MKYIMGELADIIDGDRGKNYPKQDEFHKNGFCLFLDTGNVTKDGFSFESNHFITEEKCNALKNGKMQRGDIAYTTRGTVGNAAYYSDTVPFENIRINSGMVIIRVKKEVVSAAFLYQILKHNTYRTYFRKYSTGSAQPQLPINNFSQIVLDIPPIEKQEKIAIILTAYDNLIENNQKQIKLLEEAAQRLYKEWFVDLRFPGYENVPVVDGVPEGWTKKTLSEIADIIMGQSPKSEFYNDKHEGLPFHQGVGSFGNRFVIDETYSSSYTRIAEAGSILFSVRAPVGRLNITKNKIVIGRGLAAMKQKEGYQNYLYYMLKERFFKDNLIGNGSIFASISKDELAGLSFGIPTNDIKERFNIIVQQIDEKIRVIDTQTELLAQTRDCLLPELMNGDIDI